MLSDQEKLTIKVALARARREGREAEELRKLARGFNRSEKEVRAYWDEINGGVPAPAKKEPASRLVWTTKQLEQLHSLRAEGKGPAEIARVMGLKAHQVQSRLHSEKKSQLSKSAAPVKDDPPTAPPGPPPKPEPAASEPESPDIPESPNPPASLSDAVRSFGELARKIFSPNSEETEEPDSDTETFPVSENSPFILPKEIQRLMGHLEDTVPGFRMGMLQATQDWAVCNFSVGREEYALRLKRKEPRKS